ncbi:MAG: hypothetical protein AAGH60_13415 [Pseudomonadota bacterium]
MALSKQLADRAGYTAMVATRACLRLLGVTRASRFMGHVWAFTAPFTKRHKRALTQIAAAMPELSQQQRQTIIRRMWKGLGQTFAEALLLEEITEQPERVRVLHPDRLAELLEPDKRKGGVLYISMHSGNWEVFGIPLLHLGLRAAALYQPVQNRLMEADLLRRRQTLFREGMIAKGSQAIKRVIRILKSGNAVGMLSDQRQNHRGIMVDFFGHPAPTTPLPAMLARRTDARLIVVRCLRLGPAQFEIDFKELSVPKTDDIDADIESITRDIQAQLEAWIRERPQEWMWGHRRWSREVLTPSH